MRTWIAGVALVVAPLLALAQTTLQYRWKQGEPVAYETNLKTDSTMSGMPGAGDVTLGQTMTQRVRLLPAAVAPDGTTTLQQTIEAVKVEMTTPMGKAAYDSAVPQATPDESSAPLATVFGGIVGATLSVTVAPDGAVQRIDGVQKALDKIVQNLPPQQRASAQAAQTLRAVLSEGAIRSSLEQSFPRLPSQSVKPGESWTAQVSLGSEATGRIAGTQTLTLKSIEGDVATIDVALALKQESSPPMGPSGMTMKLGDSHGSGTLTFDVAAGRIRSASMITELASTMTASGPDGRPTTIKNTTRISMTMEEIK
ncbi:MAG TPA: DUF6263 family protein [Vicinamibacterales bacterium]